MNGSEPEPSEHGHPQLRRTHAKGREHAHVRRPQVLQPAGVQTGLEGGLEVTNTENVSVHCFII